MENNSDNDSHEEQTHVDPPRKKRGRGSTKLSYIIKRQGTRNFEPLHVDFDEMMNPRCPNRHKFITYVGFVAQSKLSILFHDWRLIPEDIRDKAWTDILQNFTVPNTAAFKKHYLREVRGRWKDFKSRLTREYVRGPLSHKNPCDEWTFLKPEDWKKFKQSRLDPKFQEYSKMQQEKQKLNVYPHTMSRGGYLWLEEQLTKEQLKAMEEATQSDPNVVVQAPPPIPRHRKWIEGRKKRGKYINHEVEKVARKINDLEEKSSQGSFFQSGRMDILATAIGKPDPPGRVRAEYGTVGLKKYVNCSRNTVQIEPSQEILKKLTSQIRDEVIEQIKGEVRSMMQAGVPNLDDSPDSKSTKSNYTKPIDPPGSSLVDEGKPCFLHLDSPNMRAVAKAIQYPRASTIHNMPITEDLVKVSVLAYGGGEASTDVPFPTEEVAKIGEAIGNFILWPKRFVFDTPVTTMNDDGGNNYVSLAVLRRFVPSLPCKIKLMMDPGVVGPDKTYPFELGSSDVVAFLSMKELDLGWLELAIQYFHDMCCNEGKSKDYAFLSPMALLRNTTTKEKEKIEEHNNIMEAYVGFQFSSCRKLCYLAPILDRGHWSLCVTCPGESRIYWFDSKGRDPLPSYKRIFIKAIMHWHITCQTGRGSNKIVLSKPLCPQQPGATECGYYVMRYMDSIIKSGLHEDLSNIFYDEEPFDKDAIDDIRDRLAAWLLKHGLGSILDRF